MSKKTQNWKVTDAIDCPVDKYLIAEVSNVSVGFRHRLKCIKLGEEETTPWAGYESACFMRGIVSVTPYFGDDPRISFMTAKEFCQSWCVTAEII